MTSFTVIAAGTEVTSQQWLLLAAAVLAGFIFMRMIRRTTPSDGTPRQYRREIEAAAGQQAAIRHDLEALLIELDKLSRDVGGQIETRFARLERIIADADKRIAALRILLDAAKSAGATLNVQDPTAPSGATPAPANPSDAAPATVESRTRRIYELADQGMTADQIARQLDQHAGEVELILNLRDATGGRGWPGR